MKTASKLIAEQSKHHFDKAKTCKTQALIISDCSERESKLRAALDAGEIEITTLSSPNSLSRLPRQEYDLVVVDVGLEQIAGILNALRSKTEYAKIPVLVESSRISTEPGFAGLLPQYRAMPCCQADIVKLVKNRITPAAGNQKDRGLL